MITQPLMTPNRSRTVILTLSNHGAVRSNDYAKVNESMLLYSITEVDAKRRRWFRRIQRDALEVHSCLRKRERVNASKRSSNDERTKMSCSKCLRMLAHACMTIGSFAAKEVCQLLARGRVHMLKIYRFLWMTSGCNAFPMALQNRGRYFGRWIADVQREEFCVG